MLISISTLACDVISIQMELHMSFYSYSLVRQTLKAINHIFGPARKPAKEQVTYRVALLNALNVGVRTDLVMLWQPVQLPSRIQKQRIVLLLPCAVRRITAHSTLCWMRIIKLRSICFALEQSFHILQLSVGTFKLSIWTCQSMFVIILRYASTSISLRSRHKILYLGTQ